MTLGWRLPREGGFREHCAPWARRVILQTGLPARRVAIQEASGERTGSPRLRTGSALTDVLPGPGVPRDRPQRVSVCSQQDHHPVLGSLEAGMDVASSSVDVLSGRRLRSTEVVSFALHVCSAESPPSTVMVSAGPQILQLPSRRPRGVATHLHITSRRMIPALSRPPRASGKFDIAGRSGLFSSITNRLWP